MRISDWSSDVCSSDLVGLHRGLGALVGELEDEGQGRVVEREGGGARDRAGHVGDAIMRDAVDLVDRIVMGGGVAGLEAAALIDRDIDEHRAALHRSEEHTSELQSLMRISYAVFCLKKKHNTKLNYIHITAQKHTQ